MSPAQPGNLGENEVVRIWQQQLRKRRLLDDAEGRPVKIIYPGRRNDGRGGDFRDAVVISGNSWKSGDIEIHTRSSGWQAHGHHLNPAYNRVVLHVALEQDRQGNTVLQNGQTIPTIILGRYIEQILRTRYFCVPAGTSPRDRQRSHNIWTGPGTGGFSLELLNIRLNWLNWKIVRVYIREFWKPWDIPKIRNPFWN